jgi:hypothetical protein
MGLCDTGFPNPAALVTFPSGPLLGAGRDAVAPVVALQAQSQAEQGPTDAKMGDSTQEVVANGIPSLSVNVTVGREEQSRN